MGPWLNLTLVVIVTAAAVVPLGSYSARVFGDGPAPGDRLFLPVERTVYRVARIDPERGQRRTGYALSVLAFGATGATRCGEPTEYVLTAPRRRRYHPRRSAPVSRA